MIDLFLNTAVQAHADHLDPIFIRFYIHKKEIVTDNHKHYQNDRNPEFPGGPEINRGKLELGL
jgi:hypothetical protein